jgi:hypothetical protein
MRTRRDFAGLAAPVLPVAAIARDAAAGAGRTVRDRTERVRDCLGSAVDEVTERVRRGANGGPGPDLPGVP